MPTSARSLSRHLSTLCLGLGLVWAGPALAQYDTPHSGDAAFYPYSGSGACMLPPGKLPAVALSTAHFNAAQSCGGCLRVTNPANGLSVDVRVDDSCPDCDAVGLDLDLDDDAFAAIADPAVGRVAVNWQYIACPVGKVTLFTRDISNPYFAQVQVRDHRYPVKSLAWRPAGSSAKFVKLPRESYNQFTAASGFGFGTAVDFKITDVYGQVIRANGVTPQAGVSSKTGKQFPLR